ncbi:LysR family transcriptional regulator [uncultured Treponema sp.]|uniref:LysR family transcriptional regulator n=1 Tax=uncultured Treponema sp. TaxID=162155 RepID=UPI0025D2AC0D|nr:LysR family transcriptional regulator [uncultured Treponema sp.]
MTLQQIKYVLGVADSGSFNKASEKLYISQPSLTSSVHDLENELSFKIFNRNSRGITLTEKGRDFISDAKNLYHEYQKLIEKYTCHTKKSFSVSALYYAFARKAFVEVVKNFSSEGYDFSFRERKASDVIYDVMAEKSELGILYLSDSNHEAISKNLKENKLSFHKLTECSAFVYMHKTHPLADRESVSLDDLSEYKFVTFDTDDLKSFFSEEDIQLYGLNQAITVADRATELNLIEHLNGYTFLSGVSGEESSEDFVLVPLKNHDGSVNRSFELGYIQKNGKKLDNISQAYISSIIKILNIK